VPAFDLNGKVALVTGGARGIGFATARRLIERGASVTVVDLDPSAVERAAAELHDSRAMGIAADVTDRGSLQRAVAQTVERFGGLDVLVANAGIAPRAATMRAMATESFERVLDVNINGVWLTVEAGLEQIVQRRGHIVVIASVYAFVNGIGVIPYAMSKAAVESLGRALRVELQQHGASASVAYFGFIDTEMVRQGLDQDPLGTEMLNSAPKFLHKRVQPKVAGEAIVAGIEKRAPRIIRPKRWALIQFGRGILNPMSDRQLERDADTQSSMRKLDARAGEEQPTTR
jgi:NAD(P)-dependent dehydrogenase (short-subunit alcohol dehydrogenase family)